MENENLQNINQISSSVSERDMKIWEHVAYCMCMKKHIEKLKNEIKNMKSATVEKKKENSWLKEQIGELDKTIDIQRDTLKASEHSLVMQQAYKETLDQDANEFRKKYAETLEMYNDELQDYRSIYENASEGYKELKTLQIQLKKLEIENMELDVAIDNLESSQKEYKQIQKDMFQKTIVKFAEFYTLYHKSRELERMVQERKKEEEQLIKEHLQLSEQVKQKKREYQTRSRIPKTPVSDPKTQPPETPPPTETKDDTINKLQKFLDEEIQPCSLTSLNFSQPTPKFNPETNKVQILENKRIKPPQRPPPIVKPNPELRKKMESIVQEAKKEVLRSNSFQINPLKSDASPFGSQQSQSSQQSVRSRPVGSQSQVKPNGVGSQTEKRASQAGSQTEKRVSQLGSQQNEAKEGVSSILKSSSQVAEKMDMGQEHVSRFFNNKKKTVTFEPNLPLQEDVFQFGIPEKKAGAFDIFQKPFQFDEMQKNEQEMNITGMMTNDSPMNSFTMETEPSNYGTYGTCDKKNELTLDFDNSLSKMDRAFAQPPFSQGPVFAPEGEVSNTFNFSRSQPANPFNFFSKN